LINNFKKLEQFDNLREYKNKFIKNSYYINLDRHRDRREYMGNQFNKNKLNCLRFNGYDKKLLTNKKLDELRNKNILDTNYHPPKGKLGSIGCLMAHTNLYKHIKQNYKEGNFLIFEDDCKILPNFNEKLNKYIKTLPLDWDMAWLGYNNIKGSKINEDWYKPVQGFFREYNSQHHCYLLNYKFIDKVLEILFPIKNNFINKDMIFRKNFDKFNAYFLKERLSIQDIEEFPISERTGNRNG